jgi:hypothetical protein
LIGDLCIGDLCIADDRVGKCRVIALAVPLGDVEARDLAGKPRRKLSVT